MTSATEVPAPETAIATVADSTGGRRARAVLGLGELRVGVIRALPQILADAGCDPWPVLARAGLRGDQFSDPRTPIRFHDAAAAADFAAEATGRPHIGLEIGQRYDPSAFGDTRRLLAQSRSVGEALATFVANHHLVDTAGVPMLLPVARGRAVFAYSVYVTGVSAVDRISDAAMAIGVHLLRALCGPSWQPLKVCLPHRAPHDVAPYREALGQNVSFNAGLCAVVFDSSWLAEPVAGAERRLRSGAAASRHVAGADARAALPLSHVVRRALSSMVFTGTATQPHLARLLSLHPRALSRRLRSEGTRFQDLLNDARMEVARQLLRDTDLRLNEIAVVLHYSDASAFTKAFQANCGVAPSAWRQRAAPAGARRHPRRLKPRPARAAGGVRAAG